MALSVAQALRFTLCLPSQRELALDGFRDRTIGSLVDFDHTSHNFPYQSIVHFR